MANVKRCDRCGMHYNRHELRKELLKEERKCYTISKYDIECDIDLGDVDLCIHCLDDFDEFLKGYAVDKNNKVDIFTTITKITDIETPKKTTLFNKMIHIKR